MIDALLPNLPESGSVSKGIGMDCMKDGTQTVRTEFCMPEKEKQPMTDFSELYTMVAFSNIVASSETEKNCSMKSEPGSFVEKEENVAELDVPDSCQVYLDQAPEFELHSGNMDEASELIRDALSRISELLNLSSCNPEKFNLTKVTDNVVEQFAEIIHVLRHIITALDSSPAGGYLPDGDTAEINKESTAELSSMLRVEQFKIEMGTQMLGCATEVQSVLAQKAEQMFTSGINQAIDPLTVTMPVEQMKKLFGGILNGSKTSDTQSGSIQCISHDLDVKMLPVGQKQLSPVSQFDTQVYRSLLKVDGGAAVSDFSAEEINGLDKVTGLDKVISGLDGDTNVEVKPSAKTVQVLENMLNLSAEQLIPKQGVVDNSDVPNVGNMPAGLAQSVTSAHIPVLTKQNVEPTEVMEQITGKMHLLNRSGITEVRIQLRPEALGEVKLRIRIEGDVVVARFQVESQQVKQIVENNIQTLKDALAQQNLYAATIDVTVGGRENMERESSGWDRHQYNENGDRTGKYFSDDSSDLDSSEQVWKLTGTDTGKRYGNNSIEYFA